MATSGTVGQTVITTDRLLDHAWRRCGLRAASQSPEQVDIAKESLYMLLTHLANRGLNLWTVTNRLIGLNVGQLEYSMPIGTLSVLNIMYCNSTQTTGTDTSTATSFQTDLGASTQIQRVGINFTTLPTSNFYIATSDDALTWTTRVTVATTDDDFPVVGTYSWYNLDPMPTAQYYRVDSTAPCAGTLFLTTRVTERPMTAFNRDTWVNQPQKDRTAPLAVNYFFQKLETPTVSIWPATSDNTNHLSVWFHRQIQDVGTLSQSIAVPSRWLDAIVTQLAHRLSMELEGVPPERVALLKTLADEYVITSEFDETDRAPIRIAPNIGVYTR